MDRISTIKDIGSLPRKFYLFSFGANDPVNLAKRFFGDKDIPSTNKESEYIHKFTQPAFIQGYLRTFFGYSMAWRGSVATIIPTNSNKGVYGLLTEVTHSYRDKTFKIGEHPINLEALFKVEAVDIGMYTFQYVGSLKGIPVYAFVGNINDYPPTAPPSKAYLDAIARVLQYSFPNPTSIEIPIRYGFNEHIVDVYVHIHTV